MTTREQARAEAIELMSRRVAERDRADAADRADAEPFAELLFVELAALGWRYVPEVHRPATGQAPDPATPAQARAYAAYIRKQFQEGQTHDHEWGTA